MNKKKFAKKHTSVNTVSKRSTSMDTSSLFIFSGIGGVSGILRAIYTGQQRSLMRHFITVAVSTFVGIIAGYTVLGFGLADGVALGVCSVSALLSESIVSGLIHLGNNFEKDPAGVINKIRRK